MSAHSGEAAVFALWDEVRGSGISDPGIAVEQISYLLALRVLYEHDRAHPLRWERLKSLSDGELLRRLRADLAPALAHGMGAAIRPTMEEARLVIEDPEILRRCVRLVDRLPIDEGPSRILGALYDHLLAFAASGERGGFGTSREVARVMVDLVDPKVGERICDPAVGTGALLLEAAKRLRAMGGSPGKELRGYDVHPGQARLAAFNLFFHGFPEVRVEQADVLAPSFVSGGFDAVLCSPPFGSIRPTEVDDELAQAGNRSELLFLERCRQILNGKAAVLVPEAVLSGRGGSFMSVRRDWLLRTRVIAVILLPPGLSSQANVRTAILFASSKGHTENVWFCPYERLANQRVGGDVNPLAPLESVPEALRAKLAGEEPRSAAAIAVAEQMFSVPFDRISEEGWSLSPAHYGETEVRAPEANPLQVLAGIRKSEAEISALLDEARDQLERLG